MSNVTVTIGVFLMKKDVKWIKDLTCLKKCGMSIQEMKEYLQLCLQGTSTIMPRKEMLRKNRKL